MQSWFYLAGSILLEVAGTTCMKLSDGFAKIVPSILVFAFYGLSFTIFSFALKKIDVSVAYAIWSGVGTVLITIIGVLHFKESVTVIKIACIGLIIIGVVGLNLSGAKH